MSKIGIARGGFWLTALLPILLLGWLTQGNAALAACSVVGLVATCTADAGNYPAGIIYNAATATTVNVDGGTTIAPTVVTDGINLSGGNVPLAVNLADGVTITTLGLDANGVMVRGEGNVDITSGAVITIDTNTLVLPGNATSGLLGWITPLGTGDINIAQGENGTIDARGAGGGGIYGLNEGTGTVTLSSAGIIRTTGEQGYGLNATTEQGGATKATLEAPGYISTEGEDASAVYALTKGGGSATVVAHGKMETSGEAADGAFASVITGIVTDVARVELSSTASISTLGDFAKGAWVRNGGLGAATVASGATVQTKGDEAFGLHARIVNNASTAEALITLATGGSVVTGGVSAHGLFAQHLGNGAATMQMESGTSVSTVGSLADGIRGESSAAVSFTQAAGATVTVSGADAFGVRLAGGTGLTVATINGIVSSSGQFGVGASAIATTGSANINIGADAFVTGGWQAAVPGVQSAGVMINSGGASVLTNLGTISAGSDRAVAGGPLAGNLTIENSGRITGFVELLGGGANAFVNNAGGLFDIRHFADTDGDGVPDTKRVAISDFGALGGSFTNNAGAMVRLAPVTGETSVDATSFYLPTVGPGAGRPLEGSFYNLSRAGVVQGQMTNLATFNNAGIIDLRGSAIGNTLVMTADAAANGVGAKNGIFIANGGTILLNTVLNAGVALGGQTGSHSDVLVVDGTQLGTGATTIIVDRREGSGALTPGNGILLVEVRNKGASAAGVFALNGDFVRDGNQAIVGGAHSYALFHNGVAADVADGNWYLRNVGLAPSVPVYEEYPKILLPLIDVPTLQQRVGNRRWNEQAAPRTPRTVFCKDPAQNYQCAVTDEQASYYLDEAGTVVTETGGIWGRIAGAHGQYVPSASTSGARYDATLWGLQAGLDGLVSEGEDGTLIAGLTVNYGRSGAEITAPGSVGNITSSAYGVGATLTWYGANGFYADGQAQLTWLDSHLSSLTTGRSLVDGNKGFGQAFSLEAGQRIALGDHWTLTPQAQLTYSNVGFDSFIDPFGTSVSLLQGQSLSGRLGLAAEYQSSWQTENGTISRLSAYGIANLEKELLDGARVNVSGYEFASRDNSLWGGVGLGGTYNWDNNKYAIYGEVSANTSLERFGDSFELGGNIGLKVKW